MTTDEELRKEVSEIGNMVRVLLEHHRPAITFAEIKDLLEVQSNTTVYGFLERNKIKALTKGRYPRLKVYEALRYNKAA